MKKLTFLILTIIILFSAHQVSAVSENANQKANNNPSNEKRNENSNNSENEVSDVEISITPSESNKNTTSPKSTTDCTTDVNNHGAYVSCIAKQKLGGKVVSVAARSDIGKKSKVSGSPTTTVSPSVSPTEDPTATVSPTVTETPTLTPTGTPNAQIESLLSAIEELIATIKGLLNL